MNEQRFIEEVKKLGISLSKNQLQQLKQFYEILIEENKVMNLTRIVEKEDVYLKHFYDSITIIKAVDLTKIETLCDVGTGAGFPGIVLKIVFPNLKITLIDALQKRVNYLNRVIQNLNLEEIEAIHTRSEDYARKNREKFDIVTARAVANLSILSEITIPMVKVNGFFIAMKAQSEEEIKESHQIIQNLSSKIEKIDEFKLPIEESVRTLIKIKKLRETSHQYPRTMDKIKKGVKLNENIYGKKEKL